jgi:hypothetical protein
MTGWAEGRNAESEIRVRILSDIESRVAIVCQISRDAVAADVGPSSARYACPALIQMKLAAAASSSITVDSNRVTAAYMPNVYAPAIAIGGSVAA